MRSRGLEGGGGASGGGHIVEETTKGQQRAMEQAAMQSGWIKGMERDKVHDSG